MLSLKPTRKSSFRDLDYDVDLQHGNNPDQLNDSLLLSPNEAIF